MTESIVRPQEGVRYAFLAVNDTANDQDYEEWLERASLKSQSGQHEEYAKICDAAVLQSIELESPFKCEFMLRSMCYAAGYHRALHEMAS